jgi:uracil-DNA glycosylase
MLENAVSHLCNQAGLKSRLPFSAPLNVLHSNFSNVLNNFDYKPTTLSIDLPVLLKRNQHNETLIICAMDPLAPEPHSAFWNIMGQKPDQSLNLWIPFSLSEPWNTPKGSMSSNLAFFETLSQYYTLYVTDLFKLFFRVPNKKGHIRSNTIAAYTQMKSTTGNDLHQEMLAKEIECIKPKAIITLGNASRDRLLSMDKFSNSLGHKSEWKQNIQMYTTVYGLPHFALPHISNAANGSKAPILNNPEFNIITGTRSNERLAKILHYTLQNQLK